MLSSGQKKSSKCDGIGIFPKCCIYLIKFVVISLRKNILIKQSIPAQNDKQRTTVGCLSKRVQKTTQLEWGRLVVTWHTTDHNHLYCKWQCSVGETDLGILCSLKLNLNFIFKKPWSHFMLFFLLIRLLQ